LGKGFYHNIQHPGKRYAGQATPTKWSNWRLIGAKTSVLAWTTPTSSRIPSALANILSSLVGNRGRHQNGYALDHGGHLTHAGHPITSSAKLYNFVRYGIKDLETGETGLVKMKVSCG